MSTDVGTLLLPMAVAALAGTWATREPLWGALAVAPVIGWQLLVGWSTGRDRGARRAIALAPLAAALAGAAWVGGPHDVVLPGSTGERTEIVGWLDEAPRLAELTAPPDAPGSRWLGSAVLRTDAGARVRLQLYVWADHLGPGDRVRARGRLSALRSARNPGEFDSARYFDRLGIVATLAVREVSDLECLAAGNVSLARSAWHVRTELSRRIACRHAEPERGLIAALALGRSDAIEPALQEGLSETGLLHALAVSGMHLALLAWMLRRPIGLVARRPVVRDAAVVLFLAGYAVLVGFSPSVVRSLAVATYVAIGDALGRRVDSGGAFGASLLACLLVEPRQAFELGFALSFAAILGLAALDGLLGPGTLRRAIAASLAAWIATAPPSAGLFGRLAPWGIPLSVLVIVPMSALLVVALVDCAVGDWVPLAPVAGALARALIGVSGLCERMDLPAPEACWAVAVVAYWALAFRLLAPGAGGEWPRRAAVALLLAPVALAVWPRARGATELWVLDGGRAHAALVVEPNGRTTLFDGGMVGDPFLEGRILRPALRALGVSGLDRVVLALPTDGATGPADRSASRIDVREVWTSAGRGDRALLAKWLERGAQLRWLYPGSGETSVHEGPERIGWWASSGGALAVSFGDGASRVVVGSGIGADAVRAAIGKPGAVPTRPVALVVLGEFPCGVDALRLATASSASRVLVGRAGEPPAEWRRRCGQAGVTVRWTAQDGAIQLVRDADSTRIVVRGWCWRAR